MPQNQKLEERIGENTSDVLTGRHALPLERRGATSAKQEISNKGFYNGLRKGAACLVVGLGLMGLAGCATTGSAVQNTQNEIGYEKFYDAHGDYKLVGRNNDIYLEKLDGSESKRITHTPNTLEMGANFVADGKYIVYTEEGTYAHFLITKEEDDSNKKLISTKEYLRYFGVPFEE
jgi:hypothetical protein